MVVVLGQVAGSSAAFALGGELLRLSPSSADAWRHALLWMTLALLPVLLIVLALREPPRAGIAGRRSRLREIWPEFMRYRTVITMLIAGMALVNLADGAVLVWAAPSLSRTFQLADHRIGAIMGAALLISGTVGPLIAGPLADWCQRSGGPRKTAWVLSGLALVSVPAGCFATMPTLHAVVVLLVLFLTVGTTLSVMVTTLSIVAIPNELRGLCVSIKFAAGTLFGFGIAPLTVSVLSGALGGPASIATALALVCGTTSLLGALAFAFGVRHVPRTIQ
jgi:MFS family permease